MVNAMKIGIFGSAFCPPTLGHLSLIDQFPEFDRIWLIPSYSHAFGKKMYPYDVRLKLTREFASDINAIKGKLQVLAVDIESKIQKENGDPVYTYDLLSALENEFGGEHKFTFIAGPDNKENWDKFYKSQEILDSWDVVFGVESKPVRSTKVRELIAKNGDFSHMVTPKVNELLNELKDTVIAGKNWGLSPKADK